MITAAGIGYMGQLGNQMFQYAALVGVRAKKGYEIAIPESNTEKRGTVPDNLNGTYIKYGLSLLDCFDLNERLATTDELKSSLKFMYSEPHHHFSPAIFDINDGTTINGYFESEKHFEHCPEEILKRFKFKEDVVKLSVERLKSISVEGKRNLAVHIRRGQDRPGLQELHPFIPKDFYDRAISLLPDRNVLIFTDDFAWVKQNFPQYKVMEWVEHQRPDFVDMCTMSMCDDHIIANSTFSWWSAWLSQAENKTVIAPNLWFGPVLSHKSTKDTIPARWKRI